jgi:hypothetical protein
MSKAPKKNKTGEGSIFSVLADGKLRPIELLKVIANESGKDRWIIDCDDPMEFLRYVERVPIEIIRRHAIPLGAKPSWVEGVGACHSFYYRSDAEPVFEDALAAIDQIRKLSRRLQNTTHRSDGDLIGTGVQLGYMLAMLHARSFEYFAHLGKVNDRNLSPRREGKPITAEARKLFRQGKSVRDVAAACGVTYSVAQRWGKIFRENF